MSTEHVEATLEGEDIVAHRAYFIQGSDPPRQIVIRIGRPKLRSSDGRYECLVEINQGDRVVVKPMNGDDAVEALLLGIMMIGVQLGCILESLPDGITWGEGKRTDIGFPALPDFSLNAIYPPEIR